MTDINRYGEEGGPDWNRRARVHEHHANPESPVEWGSAEAMMRQVREEQRKRELEEERRDALEEERLQAEERERTAQADRDRDLEQRRELDRDEREA